MHSYRGTSTKVVIPPFVCEIGENCFCGNEYIEEVILPDGLVKVGAKAFYGCKKLKLISLPSGVETLGTNAFAYSGLQEVVIPVTVTNIGKECF